MFLTKYNLTTGRAPLLGLDAPGRSVAVRLGAGTGACTPGPGHQTAQTREVVTILVLGQISAHPP